MDASFKKLARAILRGTRALDLNFLWYFLKNYGFLFG
jgi:hypothetical protein